MAKGNQLTFTLEGAEILYHNFEGRINEYNKEGKKSMAILLPPAFAEQLRRDGWHVNETKAEDEEAGEMGRPFINIKINFKFKPPRVILVTSTGMTPLTEHSIGMLDDADIANLDLTCVGSNWEIGPNTGISCYLQKAYFTINEDVLDKKYGFGFLSDGPDDE